LRARPTANFHAKVSARHVAKSSAINAAIFRMTRRIGFGVLSGRRRRTASRWRADYERQEQNS
jgi:hypothetical protein